MKLRRRTTCPVPGHGTWCSVSQEMENRYPRSAEERMALDYELAADDWRERIDRANQARVDGQAARRGKPAVFSTRRTFAVTPPA